MDDISISDQPEAHRFELRKGGAVVAWCEYNVLKGALLFTHTEVRPEHEKQGLASQLAKYAMEDMRKRGLHVIPVCQFIAGYLRRHPEYQDLVTEESRRAYRI